MTAPGTLIARYPDDPADVMAAEELSALARAVAEMVAGKCRHVPDSSRRELAEYVCDAVANALYDIGGELDGGVLMGLCDVRVTA